MRLQSFLLTFSSIKNSSKSFINFQEKTCWFFLRKKTTFYCWLLIENETLKYFCRRQFLTENIISFWDINLRRLRKRVTYIQLRTEAVQFAFIFIFCHSSRNWPMEFMFMSCLQILGSNKTRLHQPKTKIMWGYFSSPEAERKAHPPH